MTTQQFWKGLGMTLVSVIVAYVSVTPIDFPLMAVTAVCTVLAYFGKNLIPWLRSDSPPASLSFINVLSGVLLALATTFTESVGTYLLEGKILWPVVFKITVYTTGTYLLSTFFAPPYSAEKKRLFASRSYIDRYKKIATVAVLFLGLSAGVSAQSPFEGFFKPKIGTPVSAQFRAEGDKSHEFFIRPAANMNAIMFSYDKDLKAFRSSTFASAGIGLGAQWYTERNGVRVNTYGVNALFVLDASQGSSGSGAALTVNALQFVNIGIGYSWTFKEWFIPVGAVWTF
ncbi:MAG: hypothetical protein ACOXZV_00800 [Bacteroidales bacterium]|jgi:hypothetical protein